MTSNKSSPFVLGTVQLGMPYGIANTSGQPDMDEAREIIKEAWDSGIREFDTAQAYGDSEKVLGLIIKDLSLKENIKIVSKLDPRLNHQAKKDIVKACEGSLKVLGIKQLECLMLHDENKLALWTQGLSDIMQSLMEKEQIKSVGVSVYSPEKALEALNLTGIHSVQLPANILDQRFEKKNVFKIAEEKGKKVYLRSIFLQGMLLMEMDRIPKTFIYAKEILGRINQMCQEFNMSRRDLVMGYIKRNFSHISVVFGVDSKHQIRENLPSWDNPWPDQLDLNHIKKIFSDVEEKLLNPALWPK